MRRFCFIAWLMALLAPFTVFAEGSNTVCIIAIREDITHNTLYLVRRGLHEAEDKHATALILDMETNGGRVDITEEIIKLLEHATIPTYTYVNPKAFSAGAYIAAATDKIYMAPGAVIGAATPLVMNSSGDGVESLPKSIEEKMTSAMRGLIRATAQEKHHNPDVFEAMVDSALGLTIDGKEIVPKGKLLTLTSDEAARTYGHPPQPLLSAGTVDTLPNLLNQLGFANATLLNIQPYGFEIAARWITMLSPFLILIGMVAIYLEIKTPGLTIPALVAAICFGLYFAGYFVAGLAGWEEATLFIIGFAFLAFELLFPGHIISGIIGICLIMTGLILAMTEKWPGGSLVPTWPNLEIPIIKVLGSFVASVITMLILGRFLPQTSFFRKMELQTATHASDGYTTSRAIAGATIGARGVAQTMLRPAGTGLFGDHVIDVVTEGSLIEKGTPIEITVVQGSRVVVARAASLT